MKRFRFLVPGRRACPRRDGYTLVELLTATVLMLIVMGVVVQVFGLVGRSVSDSRATLEMSDELRSAAARLQSDLAGVTVTMMPPRNPANGEGYFEYIEGPIGPVVAPKEVARNNDIYNASTSQYEYDTTFIDADDILMFTTRSEGQPFVGKWYNPTTGIHTTIESNVAEVAWFVRGRTLYRRVLLVKPNVAIDNNAQGFYLNNDISIHLKVDQAHPYDTTRWSRTANTLSDLTKRECRFAHSPFQANFPFSPHASPIWVSLGLPTLRECSYVDQTSTPGFSWIAGLGASDMVTTPIHAAGDFTLDTINPTSSNPFDPWNNPHPWQQVDQATGTLLSQSSSAPGPPNQPLMGNRVAEDVILNNVIGFDVKAWDPGAPVMGLATGNVVTPEDPGYCEFLADYVYGSGSTPQPVSFGAYVDLNYMCLIGPTGNRIPGYTPSSGALFPLFHHAGYYGFPSGALASQLEAIRGTDPFKKDFSNLNSWPSKANWRSATYDTWSTHYEMNGFDEDGDGLFDQGANGFDDDGDGIVDGPNEQEAPPPYPVPLRGIQVKIRVFDPDSRQIREVTVVQEFLDK